MADTDGKSAGPSEDEVDFKLKSIKKALHMLSCVGTNKSDIDDKDLPYEKTEAKPKEKQLTEVPAEGTSVDPPTPDILPPQTNAALKEKHPEGEKESTEDKPSDSNKSKDGHKGSGDDASALEEPMSKLGISETPADPFEYNFRHNARGLFILFNVVNFDSDKGMKREGTDADADQLDWTFTSLGFEVMRFDNPKKVEMIQILQTVAGYDHTNIDCVAVGILTHGTWELYKRPEDGNIAIADQILASDDRLHLSELTDPFRVQNCHPSLKGKPKLFFIQACRGEKLAEIAEYPDDIADVPVAEKSYPGRAIHKTDSPDERPQHEDVINSPTPKAFSQEPAPLKNVDDAPKGDRGDAGDGPAWVDRQGHSLPESMPIYKDFLVAWSTAPGYFSFRNVDRGSVFIQTLCRYLDKFRSTADLLSIVTWANSEIAHQYQSYAPSSAHNPLKRNIHEKKQMPWFFSRLTKDVYFRKK